MANKKTIGATIKLDGEKEYKKAISDINNEMKLFTSEMKKTVASFGDNAKGLKALKEQTAIASETVDKQKEKISAMKGALEDATKKYGENSKEAMKWKTSLNNAETELVKMEKNLKDLKAQTTGLGKIKTVFNEWKQKLEDVRGKFKPVTDGFKKVASAAAKFASVSFKAVTAGVAAVGTAAVAAGKKMFDLASGAAEAGDTIDKQSQKMSMSAEEYQKLAYAANLSGTNMGTMQKAQKALMASGKNIPLTEALKQCANSSDAAAAATELFGAKTAQELLPMLNQGAQGIDEMLNNAEKYGQVMSNDAVNASAKFQDSLSTLKGTFTNLKNSISAEMLPGLTSIMDGFTGLLTGSKDAEKQIKEGVESLVNSFSTVASRLTGIISDILPTVTAVAPDIITALVDGIVSNLGPLLDAAIAIIETLMTTLLDGDNITKIISAAVDLVLKLVDAIVNNINPIIDAAFTVIDSLVGALLEDENLTKLINAAVELTVSITTGLLDHIPQLIDAGLRLVEGLIKGLWDNRGKIWDAIKKIGKSIISTIKSVLGIHSPSTIFADVGQNLIKGLVNGIGDAAKWVFDKIRNLGKSIIDVAKSVLGIHSPSKEFEKLGDFTGQGFGIGFVNSMKSVKQKMADAIPTDLNSEIGVKLKSSVNNIRNDFGINNNGSETENTSSGGKVFNFNLDIHIDGNGDKTNLNELAEKVSEKIYRATKKKMEVFA